MAAPYKQLGTRTRPHRERAKAAKREALAELHAGLKPLQEEPLEWLKDEAAQAWRELHPLLPHEVVRQCDAPLFAITCVLVGRMYRDELSASATNTLATCLDKMGLSPAGRRKLASILPAVGDGGAVNSRFARFACLDEDREDEFAEFDE